MEITPEEPVEHPFPIFDAKDQVVPPLAYSTYVPTMTSKGPTLAHDQLRTLAFDGSKSKVGCGIGIELTSPKGKTFFASYKVQFGCTNNIAEYEALAQGLMFAHKVTALVFKGDSEIVIKQVCSQYTCHNRRLATYRNRVWNLIENFDSFGISLIPREEN